MPDNDRSRATGPRSPVIGLIVAAVAIVAVGAALFFAGAPTFREEDAIFGEEDFPEAPLPPGAGSAPDGAADMERGGLTDGTAPEDAVDQTINTDNVPALTQSGGDPPAEESAGELEPIDEDSGDILPEIADETEMAVPGADGDGEAGNDGATGDEDETAGQ
jgi:hypothetical protein